MQAKRGQNSKPHPEKPEKGETGCVLGAGEGSNGWKWMKLDEKTHCPNQCEHHNHTTHVKSKPAETQCFRRFCGRGRRTWSRLPARVLLPGGERLAPTEAGAETGAAERHWRSLTPRHAVLEWMWGSTPESGGRAVLPGSPRQVPKQRC